MKNVNFRSSLKAVNLRPSLGSLHQSMSAGIVVLVPSDEVEDDAADESESEDDSLHDDEDGDRLHGAGA